MILVTKKLKNNKEFSHFICVLFITTSIAILFVYPSIINRVDAQYTYNQNTITNSSDNNATLYVSGSANTKVKPDKVVLSLGVETTNITANGALLADSKSMNKVLDALKEVGIKDNETSTSSFNIMPNYNYSQSSNRGNITGFTATNSIQIESSAIENVSKWIDVAVKAGANNINSIDFNLSEKKLEDTKNTLIRDSINDARIKADIVASALGLKVVGVKSINLDVLEYATPPIQFKQSSETASVSPNVTTPIVAGEQPVSEKVSIIFLVDKK
jgi:uncharacterized protein